MNLNGFKAIKFSKPQKTTLNNLKKWNNQLPIATFDFKI